MKRFGRRAEHDREAAALPDELRTLRGATAEPEAGVGADGLVEPRRGVDVGYPNPEMVDDSAVVAHRVAVHGFGTVAVRIEKECAVVVVSVLRTGAGGAVVAVAGGGPDAPELVGVSPRRRNERDVQSPSDIVASVRSGEREVAPLGVGLASVRGLDPERREHGLVEVLGGRPVGDANRHMVEHPPTMPATRLRG